MKINTKWIRDLNARPETIKLLVENIVSRLFDISLGNFFKPLVKLTHTHAHTQILEEKSATSAKFQLGTNFYGQLINLLKRGVDNENPPEPLTTVCTAIIKRINAVNLYYCSQNKNPYFNHSLFNS